VTIVYVVRRPKRCYVAHTCIFVNF